jgi:ABC-type dipeptide/oligopeptide/nickel transport system permease subunit
MSRVDTQYAGFSESPVRVNELKRFAKVFFGRPVVIFGTAVVIIFFFLGIFPGLVAPHDPLEADLANRLLQPGQMGHILGTDAIGRDLLSRLIFGSRTALMVGVVALSMSALIGTTLGLIAGYFGGLIQAVIMRTVDAVMCFPAILLALTIAAALGAGLTNVMIAIGGLASSARENDYVLAERSLGATNMRIMLCHILPNCLPPMIVVITMNMGITILAEAGLSFIGVGITPPTPAWGSMVYEGYNYLRSQPFLSLVPGFAIMVVVFAFNMVGDGLRDALDPRLRGVI